ncbi:MAG: sulfurtransferase complex subunit TusB [Methylobacter sp.]
MLHLIFQSSIETAVLDRISPGDVAVFMENAALRALQNSNISEKLSQLLSSSRLYVLSDDLAARGITPHELVKGFEVVDYAGLVELTTYNEVIQSWT